MRKMYKKYEFSGVDKVDMKILFQLDMDAQQSYSSIAKKVKVSKQVVGYRIDKLIKRGVIEKFVLMINGPKIGYVAYKFYVQLRNTDQAEFDTIISEFVDNPNLLWVAACDGKYDIILGPMARNNVHAFQIMEALQKKYSLFINKIVPLNYIDAYHQKRTYLIGKDRETEKSVFWGDEPSYHKLDDYEIRILSCLCENARMPIVKVAEKVGCSVDVVINRIKNLKNDGIIQGSRILLNKQAIGYEYYKMLLSIRFEDPSQERMFYEFMRRQNEVIDVIRMMGEWNIELDIDVRDSFEFHKLVMRIKDKFSHVIQCYDSLQIFKEHKFHFFPMGDNLRKLPV